MSYCKSIGCLAKNDDVDFWYCVKHQAVVDYCLGEGRLKWFNRLILFFRPLPPHPEVSAYAFTCGTCAKKTVQGTKPECVSLIDKGAISPICVTCLDTLVK